MPDFSELNAPQQEAVATLSGPLLVLAGAGTGKTRVITCRVASLIAHGVRPDRILSVTFTNKAAREMRERTRQLLRCRATQSPQVSTFHAYCVRVLREDIAALGYPKQFAIYDRGDQESAARKALRGIRVSEKSLRPADLLSRISRWKMSGVTEDQAGEFSDTDFDSLAAMAYRRYQQQLRGAGAADFDDLLLLTARLFREQPGVLEKHQGRFDHVQIDEYQDTNGVQFQLMQALVSRHRNICVVGDDDQSIYGWRGAEVDHILNFSSHFPGTRVVRLENNYRCTQQIIALANRLVRNNRDRHDKRLIAQKKEGAQVRILAFDDETTEAEAVVREVAWLIQDSGVCPDEVAILFRTNEQPRLFETEMRRLNVPYRLVGGRSFFDRKEIRDVLSYLRVLASPADENSLLRIINTPARSIGDSSCEKLLALAVARGCTLWEAVPEAGTAGILPGRTLAAVTAFRGLMDRYRAEILNRPKQLAEITRRLLKEVRYDQEIIRQYPDDSQQEQRRALLEDFVNSAAQYVEQTSSPSLQGFLESMALMDRDEQPGDSDQRNQAVLMTLHSAKGLEFRRVYLVGMEENILPHRRSVETGSEKAIAEERRLAYVGVTRAMDHLTLTRAQARMKWGKRRESVPSRFLFEMQAEQGEPLSEESVECKSSAVRHT